MNSPSFARTHPFRTAGKGATKKWRSPLYQLTAFSTLVGAIILLASAFSSSSSATAPVNRQGGIEPDQFAASWQNGRVDFTKLINPDSGRAFWFIAPTPQGGETIATFEYDATNNVCTTTPRSSFNLGDTVCATLTGALISQRRVSFVNPGGIILNPSVTSDPQTLKFTIPTATTTAFGSVTVSNVGSWRVTVRGLRGSSVKAFAAFRVSDPQQATADLTVKKSAPGSGQAAAGGQISFAVTVDNKGPDAAQSVELVDTVPTDSTFFSVLQSSGPVFTCNSPAQGETGSSSCTISSLAPGAVAEFTFVYGVDGTAQSGATLTTTASVSSTTTELHNVNNSHTAEAIVAEPPCSLDCPDDQIVQAEAGQAGASVSFAVPVASGNCGTTTGEQNEPGQALTCSKESGSFFVLGTTTVNCTSPTGYVCSFLITVENPGGGLSLTLQGTDPLTHECGTTFSDPGAVAFNGLNQSVEVTATANTTSGLIDRDTDPGSYIITYTAVDGANSTSVTRTVIVSDNTAPTITLEGANPYKIQQGSCLPFVDPGVSGNDSCEGSVAVISSILGPNGLTTVDPNTPGTYTITYSATDGPRTTTATRTVLVGQFQEDEVDQPASSDQPPSITLNGDSQMTIECGSGFTDPGATATACGSVPVTTSGAVDHQTPGIYLLTYTATSGGQTAEVSRTVIVEDTTAPTIVLSGANPLTVECGSAFVDPGATSQDSCAGNSPASASGTVNSQLPGTYIITYSASADPSGNVPVSVTRTVNVVDTTAPAITINGQETVTVECHTSFTDPGATANDACSGPVSVNTSGAVDVNTVGSYIITYSATDGTNPSTATRTVNVVDTTAPTITCPADISVTLPPNSTATSVSLTVGTATGNDTCSNTVTINGTRSDAQALSAPYPAGLTTITWRATDAEGNFTDCTQAIQVSYLFTGFFSPVSNLPSLNLVNAGRNIPVKFSLSGDKGLGIMAAGYPVSQQIACDSSAPLTEIEVTGPPGASILSYSPDTYHYNWQTEGSWANTCRQLIIKLNDGTEHKATFKFR